MLQNLPSHEGFTQLLDNSPMTTIRIGNAPWDACISSYKDYDGDFVYHIVIKRCKVGTDTVGYNFEVSCMGQENKICYTVTTKEIEEMQKGYPKDTNVFEVSFLCESHELLVDVYPEYPIIGVFVKRI